MTWCLSMRERGKFHTIIREIIIDEYAMAIFENHKELRTVDILPDIDDIVENRE